MEYDRESLLDVQNLDDVPVATLATDIHDLVVSQVDSPIRRREPLSVVVLGPILYRIRREFLGAGTLYALMANRRHFLRQCSEEPAWARLWRTRAVACETLALRIIADLAEGDSDLLAQSLVYEFFPLADGNALTASSWLRISALELAISARATQFLAHPLVVKTIEEIWDGHLVLDAQVHKAHRAASPNLILQNRHGMVSRYNFEDSTIIKPSRLRVPKYRHWLKMTSVLILVWLYVWNMEMQSIWSETLVSAWSLGFVLDEIQVLRAVGSRLYFMTLWSMCDFATAILFVAFWMLRIASIFMPASGLPFYQWAYDMLAAAGITLIPRVFAVLEASESFSRTVISVRKMIVALLWCWVAIAMFSTGFWAALAHYGKGVFSRTRVFYDLIQVLFGFTPAVWQSWKAYPTWLGSGVLFAYLFLSQFVITTIVIAALTARYSETMEHSLEEYHFLNAVKTEVKIKSERQNYFFFCEPFNLVSWALTPLSWALQPRQYLLLQRVVLKMTHWQVFVVIYLYERTSAAILARKQSIATRQMRRLQSQVKRRSHRWTSAEPLTSSTRESTRFGLVDEALSQFTPSSEVPVNMGTSGSRSQGSNSEAPPARHRSYSGISHFTERSRASIYSESEDLQIYIRELHEANERMEHMLETIVSRLDASGHTRD